jgi:hypothetical protein
MIEAYFVIVGLILGIAFVATTIWIIIEQWNKPDDE